MNLTLIKPPDYEPVSLQDCYEHLRLTPTGSPLEHPDDAMLRRHIATARRDVERITHRALVRQKLRLSAPWFCNLGLLRPPLIEVDSVQYYDSTNALQSLGAASWYLTDSLIPQVQLVLGAQPGVYARPDAVRVTYWAGYPANNSPADTDRDAQIANVPSEARDAILLGVELLYNPMSPEQRKAIMDARDALLSDLKVYGVA